MELHTDKVSGNYIQSVSLDALTVAGILYPGPLIVSPTRIITPWTLGPLQSLTLADFAPVLALNPEVILFGTGPLHRFFQHRLMTHILSQGVGFEVMATPAACRTYNVLMGEDRRVVAALILNPDPP